MHPPQIPLTPQTNPQSFPVWDHKAAPGKSGHGYPKMLTRTFTEEDRDLWLKRNMRTDQNTRQTYYEERVPDVGIEMPIKATRELVNAGLAEAVGADVVCQNADDEKKILMVLGNEAWLEGKPKPSFEVGQTETLEQVLSTPAEKLQAENDKLRALLAERDKLQSQLHGPQKDAEPPKQRRKRGPNKPKQAAAEVVNKAAKDSGKPIKQTPLQRVRAMSAAQLAGNED